MLEPFFPGGELAKNFKNVFFEDIDSKNLMLSQKCHIDVHIRQRNVHASNFGHWMSHEILKAFDVIEASAH